MSSPLPASARIPFFSIAARVAPRAARRDVRQDVRPDVLPGAPSVVRSAADNLHLIQAQGRRLLPALFVSTATFGAADGHHGAVLAAVALSLLAAGAAFRWTTFALAAVAACAVIWLGPIAMPILAFVVLSPLLGSVCALSCAATVLLAGEWSPKVVLVAATNMPAVASTAAVLLAPVLAALALTVAVPRQRWAASVGRTLGLGIVLSAAIWGLCEARWISPGVLSAPLIRLALTFGFVALCAVSADHVTELAQARPVALLTSMILCAALVVVVASRPGSATSIVFDESHGDWASVRLPLGPDDFGRDTTYSWRALANVLSGSGVPVASATRADRFEPPPSGALFVLKMPIEPIDPLFAKGLLDWVAAGGRLLVVADHTDLFDTAQNLNALLTAVGVRISPTAVFDRLGQPPVTARAHWSEPSWIARSRDHRYLTGSSFESLPWSAAPVHTYGMSFAEQAVYFKANRFGYFQPDLAQPFGNHIAVAMLAHGSGTIQIWLDSTHWSTFTVFLATYQDAFWQAIRRSGMGQASRTYAIALMALSLFAAAIVLWPARPQLLNVALAVSIGTTIGSAATLRLVDEVPAGNPQMIAGAIGGAASVELLTPIVESASRNYSRAFTALQKWTPVRLHASAGTTGTSIAGSVLLIDATAHELPEASRIIEWVASGKRVVILSDPRILTVAEQQRWLRELGFVLRAERGLAAERDASSDLLGRRQAGVVRRAFVRFGPLDASPWIETESTHLAQTFVLRSSAHRALISSGALVLSARSEQFSDAAMGEVWDGVPVDDVSRSLEHELARLVLGDDAVQPLEAIEWPLRAAPSAPFPDRLPDRFMVVSQGQIQAEGILSPKSPGEELSFAETPDAFAWRLRQDAARFMPNCRINSTSGYCSRTLVDSRLVEWLVVPRRDALGRVVRLELIHEGRFSGVRDGINVLFE